MSNYFLRGQRAWARSLFVLIQSGQRSCIFSFVGEGGLARPEFSKERQVFKSKHEGALETEKSAHSVQTARPTSQGRGQALFCLKLEIIDTWQKEKKKGLCPFLSGLTDSDFLVLNLKEKQTFFGLICLLLFAVCVISYLFFFVWLMTF